MNIAMKGLGLSDGGGSFPKPLKADESTIVFLQPRLQ